MGKRQELKIISLDTNYTREKKKKQDTYEIHSLGGTSSQNETNDEKRKNNKFKNY